MIKNLIIEELRSIADDKYALFFKKLLAVSATGYGCGDTVIGCRIPDLRVISRKRFDIISLEETEKLLQSEIHEVRMLALMIMILKFDKYENLRHTIVSLYLANTNYINNWDLVDLSAYKIVGKYFNESDDIFWSLATSNLLWDNRISVVSTFHFIKNDSFDITLKLVEYFINHEHHLMHKACGWMLREVGKKNEKLLVDFLKTHKDNMPRIMFRYACERLSSDIKVELRK